MIQTLSTSTNKKTITKTVKELTYIITSLVKQHQCDYIVIANKADMRQSFPLEYTLSIEKHQILYTEYTPLKKYRLIFNLKKMALIENGNPLDIKHIDQLTKKIRLAFLDVDQKKANLFGAKKKKG